MSSIGAPRIITPSDTEEVSAFQYLQVGVSGDVAVQTANGKTTIIKGELLDRLSLCPVGTNTRVLATGTTATDIYVWS